MDTKNIEKSLNEAKLGLDKTFSDETLNKIKTDILRSKIINFRKSVVTPLSNEIGQVIKVIKSPYHVSFLGRYSHGKTALVNALFNLTGDSKLPEGEGVVTSKVTYASFVDDINDIKCTEYKVSGEENEISFSDLQKRVGRSTEDTSAVNYYQLELPTYGKGDFAHLFAENKINLVDMPGLGGTYANDSNETRKYLEGSDMVIAVISMVEISQSSRVISDMIQEIKVPIIPVLTFCDKYKDYDIYSDCNTLDDAIEKAKDILRDKFPFLSISEVVPVSSVSGLNISRLREHIQSKIISKKTALDKIKTEASPIYRKKLLEHKKEFETLQKRIHDFSKEVDTLFSEFFIHDVETRFDIMNEVKQSHKVTRASKEIEREISSCINKLELDYKYYIKNVCNKNISSKEEFVSNLDDFRTNKLMKITANSLEPVEHRVKDYADVIKDEIKDQIDNMTLNRQDKRRLLESLEDIVNNFRNKLNLTKNIQIIKRDDYDNEWLSYNEEVGKQLLGTIITDQGSLLTIAGGTLIVIIGLIIYPVISIFGLLIIGAKIAMVSSRISKDRQRIFEKTLSTIETKMENSFDPSKIINDTKMKIDEAQRDLLESLDDELKYETKDYEEARGILETIKNDFENTFDSLNYAIEDALAEIKSERRIN